MGSQEKEFGKIKLEIKDPFNSCVNLSCRHPLSSRLKDNHNQTFQKHVESEIQAMSKDKQSKFFIVLFLCVTLSTSFCAGPATSAQTDLTFKVEQAQASWMPNRSNLRFKNNRLECLFFLTVESVQAMRNLVVETTSGQEKTVISIGNITPLQDDFIKAELEKKTIWEVPTAHNPLPNEMKTHQKLSHRAVKESWLAIQPGRPMTFTLYQDGQRLAEQQKTIHFEDRIWWKLHARPATSLDPLDYGYAFLSKRKLLVAAGDIVHIKIPVVGLNSEKQRIAIHWSVDKDHQSHEMRVACLQQSVWQEDLPTANLAPGKHTLKIQLQDAVTGDHIDELQQELIVVPPKQIKYRFGATYTDLKYDDPVVVDERDSLGKTVLAQGQSSWEEITPHYGPLQDIVVSFANRRDKMVFWRGASYVPMWVSDDVWSCWEWAETRGNREANYRGPVEPLMDRELRFGRVRVIASHPARAIVHWRYPQSTRVYTIIDDEWVDEYYYIYPDLVAVRKVMGWFLEGSWHEINEFITVVPPDMHPRTAFELPNSFSIFGLNGSQLDLNYPHPWKDWQTRWENLKKDNQHFVFKTNLKDRPKPFVGVKNLWRLYSTDWEGPYRGRHAEAIEAHKQAAALMPIEQFVGGLEAPWMACWSWPVQRVPAIGTVVCQPKHYENHPVHWCLMDLEYQPTEHKLLGNQRELKVWTHLTGLEVHVDPVQLTRSWLNPANVSEVQGLRFRQYDLNQRAYVFDAIENISVFRFQLQSAETAQIHPVIIIDRIAERSEIDLSFDGQAIDKEEFKYGFEPLTDGSLKLVIWIDKSLPASITEISIQLARETQP